MMLITACSSSHVATSHREASRVVSGKRPVWLPEALVNAPFTSSLRLIRIHSAIGINPTPM